MWPGGAGGTEERACPDPPSLADPELFRDGSVTLRVFLAQVLEQTAALADEHEQTAAGVMILQVGLELLGKALLLLDGQPHARILPGAPPPIATPPEPLRRLRWDGFVRRC